MDTDTQKPEACPKCGKMFCAMADVDAEYLDESVGDSDDVSQSGTIEE